MATGDNSSPLRWGKGQSDPVDNRELWLEVFGGEVLTAFDLATVFGDKIRTKSVGGGQKSWKFPKTWKATSEYHVPGTELLGNDFETGEVTVTADDILVSHYGFSDLDSILSHFDMRSPVSSAMGRELSKVYDKNIARQLVLAARTASDGSFPGGNVIADDSLKANGDGLYDGADWIAAIRKINENFYDNDVPEDMARFLAVPYKVFDAIKYATDANGNYLVLNRDFHGSEGAQAGGISGRAETMNVDGVTVIKSRNTPFGLGVDVTASNESSDTTVYSKYRADFRKTLAVAWTQDAVASVKIRDIMFEQTRDTRRLEDFTVASMFCGLGTLRPECAQEIQATNLTASS
jgi:hypothetical protein